MTIEEIIWYLTSEASTRGIKVLTVDEVKTLLDSMTSANRKNEKLKSIIKEAREYVEKNFVFYGKAEILKILDKENEE